MPEQYAKQELTRLLLSRNDRAKNVLVKVHEITPEDNASVTAEKYGVENQNGINPPLFVQRMADLCLGRKTVPRISF